MTCDNITVRKGQSLWRCKVSREGHDLYVPVPRVCGGEGLVFKHDIAVLFPHLCVDAQRTVQIFV